MMKNFLSDGHSCELGLTGSGNEAECVSRPGRLNSLPHSLGAGMCLRAAQPPPSAGGMLVAQLSCLATSQPSGQARLSREEAALWGLRAPCWELRDGG